MCSCTVVLAMLSIPLLKACTDFNSGSSFSSKQQQAIQQVHHFLAQLEAQAQGRLGISAINISSHVCIDY
jgi:hypothetical protein